MLTQMLVPLEREKQQRRIAEPHGHGDEEDKRQPNIFVSVGFGKVVQHAPRQRGMSRAT